MAVAKPITTPCPQKGLTRRSLLAAMPLAGVAVAAPVVAQVEAQTKRESIQRHAEVLFDLIRSEFPDEATAIAVTINSNWGPISSTGAVNVEARALGLAWREDDHLKSGGHWIEKSMGHWSPVVGRF